MPIWVGFALVHLSAAVEDFPPGPLRAPATEISATSQTITRVMATAKTYSLAVMRPLPDCERTLEGLHAALHCLLCRGRHTERMLSPSEPNERRYLLAPFYLKTFFDGTRLPHGGSNGGNLGKPPPQGGEEAWYQTSPAHG